MSVGEDIPRRIVFMDSFPRLGGAEHSLLELLRHLDRDRFSPALITSERGELSREATGLDVAVRFCPHPRKLSTMSRTALDVKSFCAGIGGLPGYLRQLAATVRKLGADLVYTNALKDHIAAALLHPAIGRPTVWHFRDRMEGPMLRRVVAALAWGASTHLIANSNFTAGQFPRLSGMHRKVTVIHNGMDLAAVDSRRGVGLESPVPSCDGPVVVVVGALCPEKGQELLIRSLPLLVRTVPNVSCWIVGEEIYSTSRHHHGYKAQLQTLAEELDMSERVHFLGWRTDVIAVIDQADILVNCSDPSLFIETFGRTLVEAMACEKPVVTIARGGPCETVVNGETGVLFETYRPETLAEGVARLAGDPPLMRRMGRAGRRRVEECFTVERYVRAIETRLDDLLGARGTTGTVSRRRDS